IDLTSPLSMCSVILRARRCTACVAATASWSSEPRGRKRREGVAGRVEERERSVAPNEQTPHGYRLRIPPDDANPVFRRYGRDGGAYVVEKRRLPCARNRPGHGRGVRRKVFPSAGAPRVGGFDDHDVP